MAAIALIRFFEETGLDHLLFAFPCADRLLRRAQVTIQRKAKS